jgi:hypothetical protein
MSAFMHSAVSFGTPDMPPSGVGSSIGPISLHTAIEPRSARRIAGPRGTQAVGGFGLAAKPLLWHASDPAATSSVRRGGLREHPGQQLGVREHRVVADR